ncbi:hypothetical protein [Bacillus atrophaeus]|uniref:hypothetical protein n=1 Tax=Bacillus atrophaeus TaxID=1452 RepID=UPI002E1E9522|nr:hypothetical protein [Bacillus atrophaeus]MED4814218.1 hypothetical protein [Bacillus atrophaeus]MED4826288.1 hypothetical protein [Bacillus atrophaeus]MED4844948.1 hypothetical protein [Bacillus atrophaeus]
MEQNKKTMGKAALEVAATAIGMVGATYTADFVMHVAARLNEINQSSENLEELESEVARQEVISEAQAKVFQEIAIADRIMRANEVEIEEYYDTQGDGAAGVQYKESNLNIGVSGSGRRISKRVYRFKGFKETELQPEAQQSEESEENQQTEE